MSAAVRASVVVPVHNRAGLTRACLERVLADLPAGCEVVAVDDASTDGSAQVLEGFGAAVRVVRLEENRGFAAACNAGAAAARGQCLVFLNNDTEPRPGWLAALLAHADADPAAAVVGARLLYPDETVQHAGVVIGQDGYPHSLYAGFPAEHPAVGRARRLQAVTGACMLVRRDSFEQAGGFDEGYFNSMEDVDLCLRIGEAGGEVHYCPDATLIHFESASRGHDGRFEPSVARYRERWRDRVHRDDLEVYAADGLLEVEYPSAHPLRISVSPRLASIERGDRHEGELEPLLREQARRNAELQRELVRLAAELSELGAPVKLSPGSSLDDVAAIRDEVERSLPRGATVLVVSRGDSELLRLGNREGRHFPGDGHGRYLGHHPADDEEALALLAAEREAGAEYLVLPGGETWWLDHYAGFAEQLGAPAVVADAEACRIYSLAPCLAATEAGR